MLAEIHVEHAQASRADGVQEPADRLAGRPAPLGESPVADRVRAGGQVRQFGREIEGVPRDVGVDDVVGHAAGTEADFNGAGGVTGVDRDEPPVQAQRVQPGQRLPPQVVGTHPADDCRLRPQGGGVVGEIRRRPAELLAPRQ